MVNTASSQAAARAHRALRRPMHWLAVAGRVGALGLVLGGVLGLSSGCSSLPSVSERPVTVARPAAPDSRLARALDLAQRPLNGFQGLADGEDALLARLALVAGADTSLDLQYYIWRDDLTGRLLTHRLLEAADRGVRVRVLLDDHGAAPNDAQLLALSAHPNLEVRLFNPVSLRTLRTLGKVLEFPRVNRRMHNKALVADGQVAILGGRNIGDAYFAAQDGVQFGDMDVLVHGPVVADVSQSFDRFWNDPATHSMESLLRQAPSPERLAELREGLRRWVDGSQGLAYVQRVGERLAHLLRPDASDFSWGKATFVVDDPSKITRPPQDRTGHLLEQFNGLVSVVPTRTLWIVSPYFIPGEQGVRSLEALVRSGVEVTVLTNSLAATDVPVVHSGYQRYRKDLLAAGVRLYELKPTATAEGEERHRASSFKGLSTAALHAKIYIADEQTIFIGSLNLDPRSARLNTESGLVCESPPLARQVAQGLQARIDQVAWRLDLEEGDVVWRDASPSSPGPWRTEPDTAWPLRGFIWLFGHLPIESQL